MKEGKITLSQEQLKTLTVINRFIDKSISRQQAAELLGLSTRQITRLKKGVLTSGAQSLIHKNTGRKPVHSVSDEWKEAVLKIYSRPEFSNANFLHFKDILSADFGIQLSYSALSSPLHAFLLHFQCVLSAYLKVFQVQQNRKSFHQH